MSDDDAPLTLDEIVREAVLRGFALGWQARDAEIAQLKADRDRYYQVAYDAPFALRRRLDDAAEEYWRRIMRGEVDLAPVR